MTDSFKEAEILKHLNHPCIVRIKDVLKTKSKKLWIVMEYADGGDLDNRIKLQKQSRSQFDENTILGRPPSPESGSPRCVLQSSTFMTEKSYTET